MAKRLTNLSVEWGSLVDNPANKGARVALFKRDDSEDDDGTSKSAEDDGGESGGSGSSRGTDREAGRAQGGGRGGVTKMIRRKGSKWCVYSEDGKLLGEHDTEQEAKAQLAAIERRKHMMKGDHEMTKAELEKRLAEGIEDATKREEMRKLLGLVKADERRPEDDPPPPPDTGKDDDDDDAGKSGDGGEKATKSLTALEKRLVAAEKRVEEAEKRAERAEKTAVEERGKRELVEFTKRAEQSFPHLHGNPVRKGQLLMEIERKLAKEDAADVIKMLESGEKLAMESGMFDERGATGTDAGGINGEAAANKIERMAKDLVEKGTCKTYEDAVAKVLKDDERLYREHARATALRI
jgi:hypothetical protein